MPPPSSAKADESRGLDELVVRQREGEAAEKPKAKLEWENHCFTPTEDMNDDMENQMTEVLVLPVVGEVDSEKEEWVKRKDHQGKDKKECEQEENSGLWHTTTGPAEPLRLEKPVQEATRLKVQQVQLWVLWMLSRRREGPYQPTLRDERELARYLQEADNDLGEGATASSLQAFNSETRIRN